MKNPQNLEHDVKEFTHIDTSFRSHGTTCATWLYSPEGINKPPVIIMAHGFGGECTFRLPAYAEHFARQGMACLVFDYRTFGDSEGEPRNYISPSQHLEDWQAAIQHSRPLIRWTTHAWRYGEPPSAVDM